MTECQAGQEHPQVLLRRVEEPQKQVKGLGSNVKLLERRCLLVSPIAVVHSGELAVRMGPLADGGKVDGAWSTLVGM